MGDSCDRLTTETEWRERAIEDRKRSIEKAEALYKRRADVFDAMSDDELLGKPWCVYCDHGEETDEEYDARHSEALVAEWLLKQRGRDDLLRDLYERWIGLGCPTLYDFYGFEGADGAKIDTNQEPKRG
jgi:hypothetical protein